MDKKRAVIIGAGPAGLTAAYELLKRSDIVPVVLEKSTYMGGISRTVNYKGNRIDIGGHRFFSKSDRVMNWWMNMLPLESRDGGQEFITYHNMTRSLDAPAQGADPAKSDAVMLVRNRRSRIYYLRRFFDYPITLSKDTIVKLGLARTAGIGISYCKSAMFPIKNEETLEQFFINRFGDRLYRTFFKSYTEKVWGVPCDQISAEWGAQRIKGLSIWGTVMHMLKKATSNGSNGDLRQKNTETSLIEKFLYPKHGPGQMWEEVARQVREMGGEIHTECRVNRILTEGKRVVALEAECGGQLQRFEGDYFFSTAPIQELVRSLDVPPPANVREVADGLVYRDFITVGLLVSSLRIKEDSADANRLIRDNWIYIQEPDVLLGRLQIFNNWSPYMVSDPNKIWLGLEYFCNDGDELARRTDAEMIALGKEELSRIGIIEAGAVEDATVLRMEKTYPAYFGSYDRFGEVRSYLDDFSNLFLVGRNGMHRYNNQDHSMLTAMMAVDNILAGRTDKSNLWDVNTEMEYHEEKK